MSGFFRATQQFFICQNRINLLFSAKSLLWCLLPINPAFQFGNEFHPRVENFSFDEPFPALVKALLFLLALGQFLFLIVGFFLAEKDQKFYPWQILGPFFERMLS